MKSNVLVSELSIVLKLVYSETINILKKSGYFTFIFYL